MRYVGLGACGLRVSRLALGMMSFGDPAEAGWYLREDAAEPIVRRAVESGVTFFDTADMYSGGESERITGRLLARYFGRREDYLLATKVYYPMGPGANDGGLSRAHILAAVDASLRRLGTDHIDLYQVHRWDSATPIEETVLALHDAVRAGKVRYLGASLMHARQFATAQHAASRGGGSGFVSMQTRYNLAFREEEREMIPLCTDQGVAVLPYSPLARGLLARTPGSGVPATTRQATLRARSSAPDNDAEIVDALGEVAAGLGVPPARVALAWLLAKPAVAAPIVGVTRPEQLDDALAAVDLPLGADAIARLEAPYRPHLPYGY